MTQQKRIASAPSTPFSDWLRKPEQKEIDSSLGYWTTDIDYVWYDSQMGQLMLLEEKQHKATRTLPQREIYGILDQALRRACSKRTAIFNCKTGFVVYRGFFVIQFEKSSPDDGLIYINGQRVSRDQLIQFLRFEWFPEPAK